MATVAVMLLGGAGTCALFAQSQPTPLYKVQVVDATTVAVNYGNRELPTKIKLVGTVLLPLARGEATVFSRRGATQISAKLEGLPDPARYGAQYLTYVLWALTPNGRAANLGQLVPGPNNKAKIKTTTELQTFALVVTAEPYYAVTEPSNVVVAENVLHPDTQGRVEMVKIHAQLLPRGEVKYDLASAAAVDRAPQKLVSMQEYEALLELYQAQNAIYRAQEAGADQHAREIYQKAEHLLEEARRQHQAKAFKQVVAISRQATQTAEDARLVAQKKPRPSAE
ncbi:MAG: DUF4398 domain-containing protein [Bryobacteraceae bacterium]|nr:DUF4398 domain-containing protein [Bryobacteraceae bacterium]MDW8377794.1 DUF4398 domain-containing protein [Bryobacterales bacterium]